jgi:hypothetical protein
VGERIPGQLEVRPAFETLRKKHFAARPLTSAANGLLKNR